MTLKRIYLPSLASSSISDGERFVFRHSVAMTPIRVVAQHSKSTTNNSIKTPPMAIPTIEADDNA